MSFRSPYANALAALPTALPAPSAHPSMNILGAPRLSVFPSFSAFSSQTPFPTPSPSNFPTPSPSISHDAKILHLRHTIRELISENQNALHDVVNYEVYKALIIIFGVIITSILIVGMLNYIVDKYKTPLMYPDLDKLYKENAAKVKAKKSPYIEPMPDSPVLPQCLKLDKAEKGQNVLLRYSSPYRRQAAVTEGFTPDSAGETRITIVVD